MNNVWLFTTIILGAFTIFTIISMILMIKNAKVVIAKSEGDGSKISTWREMEKYYESLADELRKRIEKAEEKGNQ